MHIQSVIPHLCCSCSHLQSVFSPSSFLYSFSFHPHSFFFIFSYSFFVFTHLSFSRHGNFYLVWCHTHSLQKTPRGTTQVCCQANDCSHSTQYLLFPLSCLWWCYWSRYHKDRVKTKRFVQQASNIVSHGFAAVPNRSKFQLPVSQQISRRQKVQNKWHRDLKSKHSNWDIDM